MNKMTNFKGVIDTTLRDGQQSPLLFDSRTYRFSIEDKKTIVNGLLQLGVRYFEFFSPVVGRAEATDFLVLRNYIKSIEDSSVLLAHVRCHEEDITRALEAKFDGINIFLSVNGSSRAKYGEHAQSRIDTGLKLIADLRKQYPGLYIRFSVEDFFRTPLKDVTAAYDAVAPYVQTLGMPDTVGVATPSLVRNRIRYLRARYPDTDIECHFHNDRGLSLINAMAAIDSGASYIDTSIWGLAERSGITSVTALLLNVAYDHPQLVRDYNLMLSYPVNVLMGSILNTNVPITEPVSLTNRTHTAGVHQKAVISSPDVYEAHDLSDFGVTKNQLLLGPLSGWNLIYYYLREVRYLDIAEAQAKALTAEFKKQSSRINRTFTPESLLDELVGQFDIPPMKIQQEYTMGRIEHLP